jgi:acyl-CoA thioester hydrolase
VIHEVRVIFGDTDQMGIVYYANYYRYFEAARAGLLRAHGHGNKDMLEWGVALPVIESHCSYKSPAHYEDLLQVHTSIEQVRGASMRFVYRIVRDDTLLVEGYTVHACVRPDTGRPRRIPPELLAILQPDSV